MPLTPAQKICQNRYNHSEKGKAARRRYFDSPKGKLARRRYKLRVAEKNKAKALEAIRLKQIADKK